MAHDRIASLDLLRGIAAFAVAIPHFIIVATDGATTGGSATAERISVLAVEVFFVLSGFVLAPQIVACVSDRRAATLGTFLVRRWMRTVPPYLFALVLISLLADRLLSGDFVRYALYVQNLAGQHNAVDYFPVAWSLSIEEWFYVAFPLWALLATAWLGGSDHARLAITALAFIALVTLARSLLGPYDDWGPAVRRVVVFRVDSIAYGFLLWLGVRALERRTAGRAGSVLAVAAPPLLAATAYAAFALTGAVAAQPGRLAAHAFPFAVAAFGASAILLAYALGRAIQARPSLRAACDQLGKMSYSVYLFHLVIALAVRGVVPDLPLAAQLAVFMVACLGGSAVFFHVFERPILAARPRYRVDAPPAAQGAAARGSASA